MKTYQPNSIPLQLRAMSAVLLLALLVYALSAVLTGYTYVPGKRGGFFLSGIPTLMVVFAAICASVAATLTILDHYDRRPNEATYRAARRRALQLGLIAFVAAPFVQLLDALLLLGGLDLLPRFQGLAHQYTLHSPQLRAYLPTIAPVVAASVPIAVASFVLIGLGWLLHARFAARTRRLVPVLLSLGLFGLAAVMLADTVEAFLAGEVQPGSRRQRAPVTAEAEPAKFNAVLLTRFALGGLLLVGSATLLVAAARGRGPAGDDADPGPSRGKAKAPQQRRKRSRGA